ncbi:MAG: hypothetical protein K2H29_06605 [Oscillospiraceae bacterium]|nr:hypothetical protein [Oscillospiraceae bacterium]
MKLNLKVLLCLLVSCVYCLSGCHALPDSSGSSESPEQQETFLTYKALPLPDLFVDVPEYYETKSSQFYQEYYVCEDASIIITEDTRESQYISNYDYAVGALQEYQNMTSSLELRSSEAITTDQQMNVQTLEFDYTIGDGDDAARLTCLVGYLTDGNSMYIITCKSNTDTYENHRGEFFSVIRSAVISK